MANYGGIFLDRKHNLKDNLGFDHTIVNIIMYFSVS